MTSLYPRDHNRSERVGLSPKEQTWRNRRIAVFVRYGGTDSELSERFGSDARHCRLIAQAYWKAEERKERVGS